MGVHKTAETSLETHSCSTRMSVISKSYLRYASKKVPISRPYNGTGNSVPFPFNFRAVAVLVRFQTIPVLSHGQPVRSGERPGPYGVIKRAQSLIAVINAGRLATVQ